MNKKIALLMLVASFSILSVKPAESAKKYSFALVQQAEEKFQQKVDLLSNALTGITERLRVFEASLDKEDFVSLSVEDKLKLKYLLHQVIAYK